MKQIDPKMPCIKTRCTGETVTVYLASYDESIMQPLSDIKRSLLEEDKQLFTDWCDAFKAYLQRRIKAKTGVDVEHFHTIKKADSN